MRSDHGNWKTWALVLVAWTLMFAPQSSAATDEVELKCGASRRATVAPGSIAIVTAERFGIDAIQGERDAAGDHPLEVGGVRVSIGGKPARIQGVGPTEITILVPLDMESGEHEIVVSGLPEERTLTGLGYVSPRAPAIFSLDSTGTGTGQIQDTETGKNSPFTTPRPDGGALTKVYVFATGLGPAPTAGEEDEDATPLLTATTRTGSVLLPIQNTVRSEWFPGLDVLEAELPAELDGAGTVSITLSLGAYTSNPITIEMHVRSMPTFELLTAEVHPGGEVRARVEGTVPGTIQEGDAGVVFVIQIDDRLTIPLSATETDDGEVFFTVPPLPAESGSAWYMGPAQFCVTLGESSSCSNASLEILEPAKAPGEVGDLLLQFSEALAAGRFRMAEEEQDAAVAEAIRENAEAYLADIRKKVESARSGQPVLIDLAGPEDTVTQVPFTLDEISRIESILVLNTDLADLLERRKKPHSSGTRHASDWSGFTRERELEDAATEFRALEKLLNVYTNADIIATIAAATAGCVVSTIGCPAGAAAALLAKETFSTGMLYLSIPVVIDMVRFEAHPIRLTEIGIDQGASQEIPPSAKKTISIYGQFSKVSRLKGWTDGVANIVVPFLLGEISDMIPARIKIPYTGIILPVPKFARPLIEEAVDFWYTVKISALSKTTDLIPVSILREYDKPRDPVRIELSRRTVTADTERGKSSDLVLAMGTGHEGFIQVFPGTKPGSVDRYKLTANSNVLWMGDTAPAETLTVTVGAPPVKFVGITPSAKTVPGDGEFYVDLKLDGMAPAGGVKVVLTASPKGVLRLPTDTTIFAGNTNRRVKITTWAVSVPKVVTLKAEALGVTKEEIITVEPGSGFLSRVVTTPASVVGGQNATGRVDLSKPAPVGGLLVSLRSSDSKATVPLNVVVPEGQTSVTFPILTKSVSANVSATITATMLSEEVTTVLTVTPPLPVLLSAVTLNQSSVEGGRAISGTVELTAPTVSGSLNILLSANSPVVTVPSQVTISAGQRSATFIVQTQSVSSRQQVTITASLNGVSKTAVLSVEPESVRLVSVSLSPSIVNGGATSIGSVNLSGPAPVGGRTITLSSNSQTVNVPSSVVVPQNATSAQFNATTQTVNSPVTAIVTAAFAGAVFTAQLQVVPSQATPNSWVERFDNAPNYSNKWTMAQQGTTQLTYTNGNLRIRAANSNPPSQIQFTALPVFTGTRQEYEVQFNHQGYGRTAFVVNASRNSKPVGGIWLDTNDVPTLGFWSELTPTGQRENAWTFSNAPYMNRWVTLKIVIVGKEVQFYADGVLKDKFALAQVETSNTLTIHTGSAWWKSGWNDSSWSSVTVTTTQ